MRRVLTQILNLKQSQHLTEAQELFRAGDLNAALKAAKTCRDDYNSSRQDVLFAKGMIVRILNEKNKQNKNSEQENSSIPKLNN